MSSTTCYIHPDKAANTSCEECNRPICPADHRTVYTDAAKIRKKLVCPNCEGKVKDRQKSQTTLVYTLISVISVAAILVMFGVVFEWF